MEIKLLDCTLRDGGFVNEWNFGRNTILNIFRGLVKANLDYIEIGFIDDSENKSIERTIVPNVETINEIFFNEDKKNSTVLAMVDYGKCDIKNITDCSKTFIDGIRIIFKKKDVENALKYCMQIQNKGYKVFVQPVSITSYSLEEWKILIDKVNELQPYAISIIDTYGLLNPSTLMQYFSILEANISQSIGIGFHSHNNLQLSYSNCIELIRKCNNVKELVLDGSLYGMGKSAGNTNIELLASYLNANRDKNYDVNELLYLIDEEIMKIYSKYQWGYSVKYFLSAINSCHQNYVRYLMDKNTLNIREVNDILKNVKNNLSFDKMKIEIVYNQYMDQKCKK